MSGADIAACDRIDSVVLDGEALTRLSPIQEADRVQATNDLAAENRFALAHHPGPYVLHLSVQEGRLVFDVRDLADTPLHSIALAMGPFRGLVKDYQMLVDSHVMAMEEGRADRIQAIDMGRRGLHNEGATLMVERLDGKVTIDFETARRLFTLVCVLHQRI
ncbi:UPF0262 family protein [Acidisphaera sp. L21]|uniref:UPF0262 family protein n=1 Tax=Acidisphaera sp. L21 TaxID=1641851 RepID=UPI00131D38F6|nr:UPF0262 family protein [Acidisphaera sp. L21]